MQTIGPRELGFLLKGLEWTVALSVIGLALGAVAGLLIALARTSDVAPLRKLTAAYIAVFQGTPLLMQLFVTYYGLALAGLRLDPWASVAIGFTLHASAFLGEIWRGSIEAVPRGQTEAANALGVNFTLDAHAQHHPAAGVAHLAAGHHRLPGAADQGHLAGGDRRLHGAGSNT